MRCDENATFWAHSCKEMSSPYVHHPWWCPHPQPGPVVTIVSTLHRSVVMRPSDRQHEPVKQSTKNVCLFGGIQFMHKCTVSNLYSCIDMSFTPGC